MLAHALHTIIQCLMVSLLRLRPLDCLQKQNLELVIRQTSKYCESFSKISIYEISPDETYKAALWGGLQRNLRIMGTLTELHINLKRSFRMNDLPQIVSNTAELSMELNQVQLANFLQDNVSQALEKELLKI